MLSPMFWLSVGAAFFFIKWVAEGLWSLAEVDVRRRKSVRSRTVTMLPGEHVEYGEQESALDEAA